MEKEVTEPEPGKKKKKKLSEGKRRKIHKRKLTKEKLQENIVNDFLKEE